MENNFLKNKDFSKISVKFLEKIASTIATIFLLAFFFVCFEIYVPVNPSSHETIIFSVQKGWSDDDIGTSLQKLGIIRSSYFFKFYSILSLKHSKLQAGEYNLSPKMSAWQIANKMEQGDVLRDKLVILEGWDKKDIGKYLESKGVCKQSYFITLTNKDYSEDFAFLQDKPKKADVEGYLFPDTYEIAKGETCEDVLNAMLANFDKKLTPELRAEIKNKKRSIFDVVTMASILEKEVITLDDKKMVAGILWKRLAIDMPLQLDSTVIYATGNANISVKDTKIDSPYNTYKYRGLPKGPISEPGIDSITAAIRPKASKYWFYLTDGKTIFSETFDQHNEAAAKYLH
ncbi:MAG: endolytic transglycosylase MltG [Candidatus Staskawiczbacteria bacterium]|nr:endolytic transglycosylase MltG [Candidatus Staskawiczbacteria bacterium]